MLETQTHVCTTPKPGVNLSGIIYMSYFRSSEISYKNRKAVYHGGGCGGTLLRMPFTEFLQES